MGETRGEKGDGTRAEGEQGRELLVTTFASAGDFSSPHNTQIQDPRAIFCSFLPFHLFFLQTISVSTTRFRGSGKEEIGVSGSEWGRRGVVHTKNMHKFPRELFPLQSKAGRKCGPKSYKRGK